MQPEKLSNPEIAQARKSRYGWGFSAQLLMRYELQRSTLYVLGPAKRREVHAIAGNARSSMWVVCGQDRCSAETTRASAGLPP